MKWRRRRIAKARRVGKLFGAGAAEHTKRKAKPREDQLKLEEQSKLRRALDLPNGKREPSKKVKKAKS